MPITVTITTVAGLTPAAGIVDISAVPSAPWAVESSAISDTSGVTINSMAYTINNGPAQFVSINGTGNFNLTAMDIPTNGNYLLAVYAYGVKTTSPPATESGLATVSIRHTGIVPPPNPPTPPGGGPPAPLPI